MENVVCFSRKVVYAFFCMLGISISSNSTSFEAYFNEVSFLSTMGRAAKSERGIISDFRFPVERTPITTCLKQCQQMCHLACQKFIRFNWLIGGHVLNYQMLHVVQSKCYTHVAGHSSYGSVISRIH